MTKQDCLFVIPSGNFHIQQGLGNKSVRDW